CFDVASLPVDSPQFLTSLIQRKDKEFFDNTFEPHRARAAEDFTYELLSNILQPIQSYQNLEYPNPDRAGQNTELDALYILGDALVLCEVKAGAISPSARRGSLDRIRRDFRDVLGKAFEQGNRTLKYLESTEIAHFKSLRDGRALDLSLNDFEYVYIVCVTLEPIFTIGSQLPKLKELGILRGEGWPWCVSIYDLQAISELAESPCQFLHFLRQRNSLNRPQFEVSDELDFFGLYLSEGLYFPEKATEDYTRLGFLGYCDGINDYFNWQAGILGKEPPKPAQQNPPRFRLLLEAVQRSRPKHFIAASFALLDCDGVTREEIARRIEGLEKQVRRDKSRHSITMTFNEQSRALSLFCAPDINPEDDFSGIAQRHFREYKLDQEVIIGWQGNLETTNRIAVWVHNRGDET
ncbi:MAG: hypothetical protein ABIJ61_01415, partial [bacterium]